MCNTLLALKRVCSASIPSSSSPISPPAFLPQYFSSQARSAAWVEVSQRGNLGASLLQQILAATAYVSSAARNTAAAALQSLITSAVVLMAACGVPAVAGGDMPWH